MPPPENRESIAAGLAESTTSQLRSQCSVIFRSELRRILTTPDRWWHVCSTCFQEVGVTPAQATTSARSVSVAPGPHQVTVRLTGPFDLGCMAAARQAIRVAAAYRLPVIAIDMTEVSQLSAEGATLLLLMTRHARRLRRKIYMTGVSGQPRTMLATRRMTLMLDVRDGFPPV